MISVHQPTAKCSQIARECGDRHCEMAVNRIEGAVENLVKGAELRNEGSIHCFVKRWSYATRVACAACKEGGATTLQCG